LIYQPFKPDTVFTSTDEKMLYLMPTSRISFHGQPCAIVYELFLHCYFISRTAVWRGASSGQRVFRSFVELTYLKHLPVVLVVDYFTALSEPRPAVFNLVQLTAR
jgi:hypothetical protein